MTNPLPQDEVDSDKPVDNENPSTSSQSLGGELDDDGILRLGDLVVPDIVTFRGGVKIPAAAKEKSAKPAKPAKPKTKEREFGVPVPGVILPEPQWSHTGIKKLPEEGPLDFPALFGRVAPLVLDLGCGNARSTLASAVWKPQFDHLAVDVLPVVIRYATRRANQRGLKNVRFAVIGGKELLEKYIAPGSIREIHVYHPQPYYDPADVHKRLITPEFLRLVHRSLEPEGLFVLQTDNPGYWKYIQKIAPYFFRFTHHRDRWPDSPKGRTRREIIALRQGLPIYRSSGWPKAGISPEEAQKMAESLPPPTFDADRHLQELDRLERQH